MRFARFSILLLLLAAATFAQSASAQTPLAQTKPALTPAKPAETTKEPTAAQEFKNIQVLKDVPAKEWWATMQFMAASLGVPCRHCHVNPFAKDEKPAKARAREMMRMVQAINQQNFAEQTNRVTCMTCHNGSIKPLKSPVIAQATWMPAFLSVGKEKEEQSEQTETATKAATPAALPDAQAVLAKYRAAIGAANAASVRSRYYKGTVTFYEGNSEPRNLEQVIYLAGNHVRADFTDAQGTQSSIYDGSKGWVVTPKEMHAMNDDEMAILKARVLNPLKIDALPEATQATTKGAEEMRGHQTWAVELTTADNKTNTFFFDQQSGLLVARRGYIETAFGKVPEETWYDDYRDFGGVRLPMTITSAGVTQAQSRRYEEIQINVPVDKKRFEPPAAGTGTGN